MGGNKAEHNWRMIMINVYHSKNTRDSFMYSSDSEFYSLADAKSAFAFNDGYELVATVDTEILDVAYGGTNHITSSWMENSWVEAFVEKARSTSVGDILVNDITGEAVIVAPFGFDVIREGFIK